MVGVDVTVCVGVGVSVASGGVKVGSGSGIVGVGVGVIPVQGPASISMDTGEPFNVYPSVATLVLMPGAVRKYKSGVTNFHTLFSVSKLNDHMS